MNITTQMSFLGEMELACLEGNHEVVKKLLSSHPESINFSSEVGILFIIFLFLSSSPISHFLNLVFCS